MKTKFIFFISFLVIILFLSGCAQEQTQTPVNKENVSTSVNKEITTTVNKENIPIPINKENTTTSLNKDTTTSVNKDEATTSISKENLTKPVTTAPTDQEMVDCGKATDPSCFMNRMNQCLPVTAKMISSDNTTAIEITVLGTVNDTCHFQRKLNNVLNIDCYFPKGTLNSDTLDQTFGNDRGLQKVVDSACKMQGW